ncbi:MAG TPA: HAD family hydrolase [Candidatus Acidoferrum sp.]|nr:HAD family hydrolase [Candidatus Acidoferrum sp.]
MIAALLFDFGGTLDADGLPWKERFRQLYRACGVDADDEVFDPVFYAADDALVGALPPGCGLRGTVELLADGVSAKLGVSDARLTARVARRFLDTSLVRLSASARMLARLRGRYRLGLVSNFYGNLAAVCAEAGIADHFDVMVDSTRVGFTKPDARIFRHATDALGIDPAGVTFIGDSPTRDMAGARGVGMPHVWLTGQASPKPCCPGDRVIPRLADLERVL